MTPSRSLRRPTLLIVGCGDVGLRVARLLRGRWRVLALSSSPSRFALLREAGAVPVWGDLDQPHTLRRLAGLADRVLHLAPPPGHGDTDPRTAHLLTALARRELAPRIVYGSTSGVYGDCGGAWVDESRPVAPASDRARRRVDAERWLRATGRIGLARVSLLRIPGIYAVDRVGGHPRDRLSKGTPVLRDEDDVFTNHIHADDLARACIAALHRGAPQRAYQITDDTTMKMGAYFDLAADLCGLPRPERITRAQAEGVFSAMQLSFMAESRRLSHRRMTRELKLKLRYPTVREGLTAGMP